MAKSAITELIVKFMEVAPAELDGILTRIYLNVQNKLYPLGNKGVFYGSLFPGICPGFLLTNISPINTLYVL